MGTQGFSVNTIKRVAASYMIACGVWGAVCFLSIPEHQVLLGLKPNPDYFQAMLIRFAAIAALTPPVFYLARRVAGASPLRAVGLHVVGWALFNGSYVMLRWLGSHLWNPATHALLERSSSSLELVARGAFANVTICYMTIVLAANLFVYFEDRSAAVECAELRRALASSELEALDAKLHPHFVFNVLQGIATLIDTDAARAKFMLIRLSSLLRTSLRHNSSDLVPLNEELNFVEAYVELEKMRLGSRLLFKWDIEDVTRPCLVPHLVLQQLVENAILHGVASRRKGGSVTVTSARSGRHLIMSVENSLGEQQSSGIGIGLSSIRSRLKNLYGVDARLQFIVGSAGARATVSVPFLSGEPREYQYVQEGDPCCAS
jgi:two-component system LytT family sensor kinase